MKSMSRTNTGWQHDLIDERSVEKFIRSFLEKKSHRKALTLPSKGKKVTVLVSGGFDSISLWFYLLDHYNYEVFPIYCVDKKFRRTQEEASAKYYSKYFSDRFPRLSHPLKFLPIGPKFSFRSVPLQKVNPIDIVVPNLFISKEGHIRNTLLSTPFRLLHYIIASHNFMMEEKYKKTNEIEAIFVGYVTNDSVSRESSLSVIMAINLFVSLVLGEYRYRLIAPIDKKIHFSLSKEDLARYASQHGCNLFHTWSCDMGTPTHCGVCVSCVVRKKIFKATHINDQTTYDSSSTIQQIKRLPRIIIKKIKKALVIKTNKLLEDPTARISIDKEVYTKKMNGLTYRLGKENGYIDTLNSTAEMVWEYIKKKKEVQIQELYSLMKKNYPHISHKRLQQDVDNFIRDSLKEGYLILSS